ncbi:MAG: type II secretion system F family protein [Ignavibacteriales bacterium]
MAQFAYQVLDRMGNTTSGKLEAENEAQAVENLRKSGLTVLEVKSVAAPPFADLFNSRKKVKIGDLAVFSRQLETMLDAGIPLTRCLRALGGQATNATLGDAVMKVAGSVESGTSFADALQSEPEIFPSLFIDMVRSGETGGTLVEVLARMAVQLEQDKALRDNIKSAMVYPVVVLGFAVCIMIVLMVFVVPIFIGFFPAGAELPFLTRITVGTSNALRNHPILFILILGGLIFGIRYYLKTPTGQHQWDLIKYKIPVFGPLMHKTMVARFARTLSTLLDGGIPVITAMQTAGPTSGSSLVAYAVEHATEKIQEGHNISTPLEQSGLFPPMVIQMMMVGEETGAMPSLLEKVAEFYEAEVAAMTKALTSLLEPIMLVFVGVMVGVIVISIYLPMFTVITTVGQ